MPSTLNDGGGLFFRSNGDAAGRWVFRFTSRDAGYLARQRAAGSKTKQREKGLGTFPAVTLAQAREKAADARSLTAKGLDPIEEEERRATEALENAAQAEMTFGRYADETFLPEILPRFHNHAHIQQWQATFAKHAAMIRDKPLHSITREDILAVLRPIWTTKSVTASRSRERLERLFSHAIQNGAFKGDNPAAWRQFDATLPPPRKLTRGHHAALPAAQAPEFIETLRARQGDGASALMLEFIALAACRTGEARFAVWSEIDLGKAVWSIPAERMKMRRGHEVPLTERMIEILQAAQHLHVGDPAQEDFVFPGARQGRPLSEMACMMLMRRMNYGDFTVHGLRATFKSWATAETEFPRELIEEQLAHQLGAVERAYMRGSAVERRRTLMEAWSAHLNGQKAPLDNVHQLRGAAS